MNKRWRAIFAVLAAVLLVSIILMGYFLLNRHGAKDQWRLVHDYTVSVNTTPPAKFYVHVPVPVEVGGSVSDMVNETIVTGTNASFSLVATDYGLALNISGEGAVNLRARKVADAASQQVVDVKRRHPNNDIDLDMWAGPDYNTADSDLGEVWVYLHTESENGSASLFLDLSIGDIHHRTGALKELSNGWNRVEIDGTATVPQ